MLPYFESFCNSGLIMVCAERNIVVMLKQ